MTNKDQHPAILYKYIDTTGGLSMLQKEELWFRRTGFLNDPYDCYLSHECQGKYPEFSVSFDLNELTKYFGICSLSETATTFLMWSYYNEHKGMYIGVNMKDIYTSLINHFHDKINSYLSFRKVVYKNKLPDLNLINIVPFDYQTPITYLWIICREIILSQQSIKLFSLKNNYSYICETLTHSYYVSLQQYSHSNPIR